MIKPPSETNSSTTTSSTLAALLRSARELVGLSQAQVARVLDVHRPSVSEIEAGRRAVSAGELAVLADLYGLRPADLLNAALPSRGSDHLRSFAFRQEQGNSDAAKAAIDRFLRGWHAARARRSSRSAPFPGLRVLYDARTPRSHAEAVWQGETMADDERRRLALGDEAAPDIPHLLGVQGVYVGQLTGVPQRELDGIYVRSGMQSAIGVNYGEDGWGPYRARFTEAHEYAHHLLHDVASEQLVADGRASGEDRTLAEARADAFAGAFLMPRRAMVQWFAPRAYRDGVGRPIPAGTVRRRLAAAMQHFRVSSFALLRRLTAISAITPDTEAKLREQGLSATDSDMLGVER